MRYRDKHRNHVRENPEAGRAFGPAQLILSNQAACNVT